MVYTYFSITRNIQFSFNTLIKVFQFEVYREKLMKRRIQKKEGSKRKNKKRTKG